MKDRLVNVLVMGLERLWTTKNKNIIIRMLQARILYKEHLKIIKA